MMPLKRDEVQRAIALYQTEVANLEEKEEDLARRIQIMENIIPTVVVWYMWKVSQDRLSKPTIFNEEEAQNKLLHLQKILDELQEADKVLKEEEKVMRSRIEELENSLKEGTSKVPDIRNAYPSDVSLVVLSKQASEVVERDKKIKELEKKQDHFKYLLEDPETDWRKTCEDLFDEVNVLVENLQEANIKLTEKESCIKELENDYKKKDKIVQEKIYDLEKQADALYGEVIDQVQDKDLEEQYSNRQIIDAVQEAIEEVGAIKESLLKKPEEKRSSEEKEPKGKRVTFPISKTATEEEMEVDQKYLETPVISLQENVPQPSLVTTPEELLLGAGSSSREPRVLAPQIFEPIETEPNEVIFGSSKLETGTGTLISVPPSVSSVPAVQTETFSIDHQVEPMFTVEPSVKPTVEPATQPFAFGTVASPGVSIPGTSEISTPNGQAQLQDTFPAQIDLEVRSNEVEIQPKVGVSTPRTSETLPVKPKAQAQVPAGAIRDSKALSGKSEIQPEVPLSAQMDSEVLTDKTDGQLQVSLSAPRDSEVSSGRPEIKPENGVFVPRIAEISSIKPEALTQVPIVVTSETLMTNLEPQPGTSTPVVSGSGVAEASLSIPGDTKDIPETSNLHDIESKKTSVEKPLSTTRVSSSTKTLDESNALESIKVEDPLVKQDAYKISGDPLELSRIPDVETIATYEKISSSHPPLTEDITAPQTSSGVLQEPVFVTDSDQDRTMSRGVADAIEAHAIVSEPFETSYMDELKPMSSGLSLQHEGGTLQPRPSADSLATEALRSKCRVKDHLIKTLADQLKDMSRKNIWSGDKMFKNTSSDPVKTYDFDRATLFQYLKGEEPKNFAPSLQSNKDYSSSNPLSVRVTRKLDKDSILMEWGPPPSEEVVGFQIFINGEFKYWVHSAKRNKALLHPVDLNTGFEITVAPVKANGEVVNKASILYNP